MCSPLIVSALRKKKTNEFLTDLSKALCAIQELDPKQRDVCSELFVRILKKHKISFRDCRVKKGTTRKVTPRRSEDEIYTAIWSSLFKAIKAMLKKPLPILALDFLAEITIIPLGPDAASTDEELCRCLTYGLYLGYGKLFKEIYEKGFPYCLIDAHDNVFKSWLAQSEEIIERLDSNQTSPHTE